MSKSSELSLHTHLFQLFRHLSVIWFLYILLSSFSLDLYRIFFGLLGICLYCYVSTLYQNRRYYFTPAFFIYTFLFYISYFFTPFFYDQNRLDTLQLLTNELFPDDYFILYSLSFIVVSLFIASYLSCSSLLHIGSDTRLTLQYYPLKAEIFIVSIFLIALTHFSTSLFFSKFCLPLFLFYFLRICWFIPSFHGFRLPRQLSYGLFFCSCSMILYVFYKYGSIRFIFTSYIMTALLASLYIYPIRLTRIRFYVLSSLGLLSVLAYGVFSYALKLVSNYGKDSEIFSNLFLDFDLLFDYVSIQIFRIFGVWMKLSGNIIEILDYENYFGLSYLHSIFSFLGLKSIHLPSINSATSSGSSYAQPGLFGESFVNFGFLGVVVIFIFVFLLADLFFLLYCHKRSFLFLSLSIVPFVGVILDGGSLVSILLMIVVCFLFSNVIFLRPLRFPFLPP